MLSRRGLFASVGAALCGGAATGSAPAEPAKLRQVSQDVSLLKIGPDGFEHLDWFAQKTGDQVIALWKSGRIEGWTVDGDPYMTPGGVEAVKIDEERYYCTVEPKSAFLFDPFTDTISVMRPNRTRVEVYTGKPTFATLARRPRPTRPLIGRPVIVAK